MNLMLLLASIILVGIVFILMSVSILFKKKGKFPNTHIGGNKEFAKRGIYCATTMDKMERKQTINVKYLNIDGDHDVNTTSC